MTEVDGVNSSAPAFLKFLYVISISAAGMGEWKVITNTLGGLPKAITLGAIALAVLYCIVTTDTRNLKRVIKPYLMYVLLIGMILLWSFVIWILSFTSVNSVIRGSEKMIYQMISITAAASAVVLFGFESIDLFCISMCISNSLIILFEMLRFGIGSSIKSFVHNIVTFGDAVGFARNLEIHEMTFQFGMLLIYYALFAPVRYKEEKKKNRIFLCLCIFFFIAGLKRIAVVALLITLLIGYISKKSKNPGKLMTAFGVIIFLGLFLYIKLVRDGIMSIIMTKVGINMMGRDYIWALTKEFYSFSPAFMGLGFEAVDAIAKGWYESGLLNRAYNFHNDVLKVFVELGFSGFTLWAGIQYIIYPIFFTKKYSPKVTLLYMTILIYMTFTYMTDNTAFYFWCTMCLRLLPMAYIFTLPEEEKKEKWKPMQKDEYRHAVEDNYLKRLNEGRQGF
ncbi:MAG: O-antigen ligase family protein [Eubacteriales bacterium]|nr:O-antigen ligase family protein [Eubacteriales bacterium]